MITNLTKINNELDIFVKSEFSHKRIYSEKDKLTIQENGLVYIPALYKNKDFIIPNKFYIAYAENENGVIVAFHFEIIYNTAEYDINDLFKVAKHHKNSNVTISIGVLCKAYKIKLPQTIKISKSTKVNGFKIQLLGEIKQ